MMDLKAITRILHKKITRTTTDLRELKLLNFIDANKNHSIVRLVILKGYTDKKNNLLKFKYFISKLKYMDKFELLPFHQLAKSKYESLHIKYLLKDANETTEEDLTNIKKIINK
jgi:pyruvate formate lyase activating enzyme